MLARIRKAMDEKDQGFTLIELLVVIIIIGILAAIAIPTFLNQRNKGYDAQAQSDARNIQIEVETAFTDTQAYPTALNGTTLGIKRSATATNHKYALVGTTGYCVSVESKSGKFFVAGSASAGVTKSDTNTCAGTSVLTFP